MVLHAQLRADLEAILAQQGAVKPEKVLFFRGQMQTIITRALSELGIAPVPSRRCFALLGALPPGRGLRTHLWPCLLIEGGERPAGTL